jgi:hypothetical protein
MPSNGPDLAITLQNFEVLGSNLDWETGYSDLVFFLCVNFFGLPRQIQERLLIVPHHFILHPLIRYSSIDALQSVKLKAL